MGEPAVQDAELQIAQLRDSLAESVRRLQETQSLASVGSWEWDLAELRSVWSKEMLRIFGRDPEGPPPSLEELVAAIHPEDRPGFEELVARVRSTPGPFRHSYRIVDAAGEVRHLQALGRTTLDARGAPARAYGTTQDISELKRSEEQLKRAQRLEAVGQLASGVAHDFNNLLAVILNQAELLLDDRPDGQLAASLEEIRRAGLAAADLTRHLLLFSSRQPLESGPVDLAAALAEAEPLLRSAAGERIELALEAEEGLPPVRLGLGQAEQVLVNLVVNARDAISGAGKVSVALGRGEDGQVLLSVADDGAGMDAETAARAFDPFFTTKPRDRGTGLGLATVYGIVGKAGGQVEIESEPGRGTTVSARLPEAVEGVEAPSPATEKPADGHGELVLVVDDEEAVRTIVCRMLERHGYRTVAAADADSAEAVLAEQGDVDLLLTDVVMPGMSGWELVGRLHARNPGLRAIYMSGNVMTGGVTGRPVGESALILEKPFTGMELVAAVGEVLTGGRGAARRVAGARIGACADPTSAATPSSPATSGTSPDARSPSWSPPRGRSRASSPRRSRRTAASSTRRSPPTPAAGRWSGSRRWS